MRSLPKVTFVVEDFSLGSPAQQLLDRFLIGYNRDGQFYSPGSDVELLASKQDNAAVEARMKKFGLKTSSNLEEAQSVVMIGAVRKYLAKLPNGARCFFYGTLAETSSDARDLLKIADDRKIRLRAGTAVAGAFQLPMVPAPNRGSRALAVTHGPFPQAEIEAVEALWGFSGPGNVGPKHKLLSAEAVWQSAYSREWAQLFAAAFSRSNTIQGDPVKDGRTQDVAGLRLVEKLVKEPRAWLIEEGNGSRIAVFVLNGALEDLNISFEGADRNVISTQLYRPPTPMQDHFSSLAAQIEDFFRQDAPDKPAASIVSLPAVLESMRRAWRTNP